MDCLGNPVRRHFSKHESALTTINAIIRSLKNNRALIVTFSVLAVAATVAIALANCLLQKFRSFPSPPPHSRSSSEMMNRHALKLLSSIFLLSSILLQGCATGSRKESKAPKAPLGVDYPAVQERLGIDMGSDDTGFREKKFNACDLGESLAMLPVPLRDCRQAYFTVIQFELSCRQEDQPTDILSGASLLPLDDREFKWTIGETSGKSRSDPHGRTVIRAITQKSQRRSAVRISNGVDYLIIRANELSTIATPPNWCDVR